MDCRYDNALIREETETDLDKEEPVRLEYVMQHPNKNLKEEISIENVGGDCSGAL